MRFEGRSAVVTGSASGLGRSVAQQLAGEGAKGYGVDQLAETLSSFGIVSGLVGIDGEMRALGPRPDGEPWAIAIERPDHKRRAPHSILALHDAAVATSGDYRNRTLRRSLDAAFTPPAAIEGGSR